MNTSADVVVLGGGPAGLAAGWWAARRGYSVVVLERAPRVGGLAASFEIAGIRVDHGSHRLHPATAPSILHELTALLGTDLQRRPRHGRLRLADRWLAFPPSLSDLVTRTPPRIAAQLAVDIARAPFRRARTDTFAEMVRAGVGPTLGAHLYFPLARKLWGLDPGDLDGEHARRRIGATTPLAVARRAFDRDRGRHFYYPRRGFGQIAEALADAATGAGVRVRTGCDVAAVAIGTTDGVAVHVGDDDVVEGAVVLSTIPLTALAALVTPAAPPDVATAAVALRSRAMVLVYLVLERGQWTPFDAHDLPGRDVIATRISEPRNYRDGADPDGRTVLCAEVPCWPGDEVWRAADADVAARVVDDIARLGLPEVAPSHAEVRRVPSVYPVYDRGFATRLATVEKWLGAQPRLVTLGRQGLFAHDNTHHTLEMAWEAVASLGTGAAFDQARWVGARERFRTHVVED